MISKLDDELEGVLDVEKQLERRATNFEQWGDDIAETINEGKDRVTILERYCWRWVRRRPGAGY